MPAVLFARAVADIEPKSKPAPPPSFLLPSEQHLHDAGTAVRHPWRCPNRRCPPPLLHAWQALWVAFNAQAWHIGFPTDCGPEALLALDFSHILHECRTANLASVNAQDKVMVSIGAADLWYFKWIEENCGRPARHIGVEYYMPRPSALPENVEWVSNTAGYMPDVADNVSDILFSGQNIEHLWQDEVAGFLAEAHRVLAPGGTLVLDSPNRSITAAYGGAHPEHMVELDAAEAVELITAAGFDVVRTRGIFRCRNPRSGALLPIGTLSEEAPDSVIDRCVSAIDDPENAYIWWIEARRSDRLPDVEQVKAIIDRYWAFGWPERLNRLVSNTGTLNVDPVGRAFWESEAGTAGALVYGPYAPLKAGRYRATLYARRLTKISDDTPLGWMDVVFNDAAIVSARTDLTANQLSEVDWTPLSLDFEIDAMTFGFQTRVFSNGNSALSIEKRVHLETLV